MTTLGEQVLDATEAQGKPVAKPHGVADDLSWEAVTSIQSFHDPLSLASGNLTEPSLEDAAEAITKRRETAQH